LKVHKDGSCWNGDWGILDIRVHGDGVTFLIDKMPINATKDGVVADLQKFIKLLDPYYKLEGIKGPAYFDEFHGDVMSLPDPGSERFETFQKFLGDHMAFMPPLARSDLLESFFKLCDGIRTRNAELNYGPLHWLICHTRTDIRSSMLYGDVFRFGVDKLAIGYQNNYWDLLRFIKNSIGHALNHMKVSVLFS
jgi:hypothetical protein